MNDQTITIEQIQATKTYQSLNSIQQSFIIKRGNRELLSHALIVYKNTNEIPGNVSGYNLNVLRDFILGESEKLQKDENAKTENWDWEKENTNLKN